MTHLQTHACQADRYLLGRVGWNNAGSLDRQVHCNWGCDVLCGYGHIYRKSWSDLWRKLSPISVIQLSHEQLVITTVHILVIHRFIRRAANMEGGILEAAMEIIGICQLFMPSQHNPLVRGKIDFTNHDSLSTSASLVWPNVTKTKETCLSSSRYGEIQGQLNRLHLRRFKNSPCWHRSAPSCHCRSGDVNVRE